MWVWVFDLITLSVAKIVSPWMNSEYGELMEWYGWGKLKYKEEKTCPSDTLPMASLHVLPSFCKCSTCYYFSCSSFVLKSMLLHIYRFLSAHNFFGLHQKILWHRIAIFYTSPAMSVLQAAVLSVDLVCWHCLVKSVKYCCMWVTGSRCQMMFEFNIVITEKPL